MSSYGMDWNAYFKNVFQICCKAASWEYQFVVRPVLPNYFEYENAVLEHIDALKKARQEEHQENKKELDMIEHAAKSITEQIRNGDRHLDKILEDSYKELKQLFTVSL